MTDVVKPSAQTCPLCEEEASSTTKCGICDLVVCDDCAEICKLCKERVCDFCGVVACEACKSEVCIGCAGDGEHACDCAMECGECGSESVDVNTCPNCPNIICAECRDANSTLCNSCRDHGIYKP